ncbi:MAG: tetratricopeptide repeat protein [Rubrivivax sp.]
MAAQQRDPKQPLGWLFEGEIETALGHPAAAAAAYRKAHERSNTSDSAVRLHTSLVAADAAAAAAFARQHLAAAPGDAHFVTHLAQVAAAQGRLAEAEARYRQALKLQPDHVVALNNLAELLNARRDREALALAKHAAKVAPHLAAVLDTLATAHAVAGESKQAAEVQMRAVELRPREPLLRLNLARYLIAQGDKKKAAMELRWVAQAISPTSPLRREVDALLRQADG